jgi:putative glycosyltransferase (TIGR04372 family)
MLFFLSRFLRAPEYLLNRVGGWRVIVFSCKVTEIILRIMQFSPSVGVRVKRSLARNLWFQGRVKDSLDQIDDSEKYRKYQLKKLGLENPKIALLPANCSHGIGLMGHLDSFIKYKILSGDDRSYCIDVRGSRIANKEFFNYWKAYVSEYFPDDSYAPKNRLIEELLTENWNWALPDVEKNREYGFLYTHRGMAKIQRRWHAEGRNPLLSISEEHSDILDEFKFSCGMKKDDWYVCLHVRSSGFYGEKDNASQDFRNSPIDDYYLAIEEVVKAGGWVVRMGDKSMPRLRKNFIGREKVIDYAHSEERSAALDVAICASCDLFVTTSSGLHTVAHAFGRKVCCVNIPMYAGFPWHPNEIFAPKLFFSKEEKRILTMREVFSSNLVFADHQHLLLKANVELKNNSADEIAEAVKEAMRPSLYQDSFGFGVEEREKFQTMNQKYNRDISGQLSLYFAHKYRAIIIS